MGAANSNNLIFIDKRPAREKCFHLVFLTSVNVLPTFTDILELTKRTITFTLTSNNTGLKKNIIFLSQVLKQVN